MISFEKSSYANNFFGYTQNCARDRTRMSKEMKTKLCSFRLIKKKSFASYTFITGLESFNDCILLSKADPAPAHRARAPLFENV